VEIRGVDAAECLRDVLEADFVQQVSKIDQHESVRIDTMFANIKKLRTEREGVIFCCGVLHSQNLLNKFRKANLDNEVVYYFPHSSKRYDDSMDDVQYLMNPTLQGHTHLLSERDIKLFSQKVLADVQSKARYQKELLEGTYSSHLLKRIFGATFQAFQLPGYHVDALLDKGQNPHADRIRDRLREKGF